MNIDRPNWVEIDLDNLKNNIDEIKKNKLESSKIIAIVKSDAYGHGAIPVTKKCIEEGIDIFGVATISEALELRGAGIDSEMLILGYTDVEQMKIAVKENFTMNIYDVVGARALSKLAVNMGKEAKIHIKIDTGMNRLGFQADEYGIEKIVEINNLKNIKIDGYFSHFAMSDSKDKEFSREQYSIFKTMLDRLEEKGLEIKNVHISNSAGIIDMPEYNLDLVRAGIMLYGYYPSDEVSREKVKLKRVMSFKTKISNIKDISAGKTVGYGRKYKAKTDEKIGTIPVGYGDGFTRLLSEKISVDINGKKAKLVGNICMDQSMIDCTAIENVNIGDEVTIFGGEEGNNTADELAKALGTINYEILCMISKRVPRVYIEEKKYTKTVDYLINGREISQNEFF